MLCGKNGYLFVKHITGLLFCFIAGIGIAQLNTLPEAQKEAHLLQLIAPDNTFAEHGVMAVVQDSAGFMWIATHGGGLARYDGKKIKRFTHREGDNSTIALDAIWYMHKDHYNRLWLIYNSGAFDLFDPVTEKVRHLSAELHFFQKAATALKVAKSEALIVSNTVFEDSEHRLWIRYLGFAARIDASGNGSMVIYPTSTKATDWPLSFNETSEGHLLIATNSYVQELDEKFRVVRRTLLPPQSFGLPENRFYGYTLLQNDTLYLESERGIEVYNTRTGQIFHRGGLPQTAVVALFAPHSQKKFFLFYDTVSAHLYQYTAGNNSYTDLGKYVYAAGANKNYQPGYYYDKWGGLWHFARNLFYSAATASPFTVIRNVTNPARQVNRYFYHPPSVADKWSVEDGLLPWVQSSSGATYVIDSTRRLRLMAPASSAIDKPPDGRKWQVIYTGPGYRLLSDHHFDSDGRLWVADLLKRELFTIDTAGHIRICPQQLPDGFFIASITAANEGGCWVVQLHKGLSLYTMEKGLVKVIDKGTEKARLPETSLMQMVRDNFDNNILWITTLNSGIVRFNEKEETAQTYTEQDGWPSNSIFTIVMDRKGFLWYQTVKGIYRYDPQKKKHLLVVANAVYKGSNWENAYSTIPILNRFFFVNSEEAVIINTDKLVEARNVTTVLTGIKINNKQMADGDTSLVPAPINTLSELQLAYHQNFISLQFAALNYALPEQVRYRYQLEGIDKNWVENGADNIAQYTSLPHGSYVFKVNATNEDGNWSSNVKSIRIIISPPWWRTWWMYCIYAGLLVAAGWLFIKTRLRRLQLKQQVVLKQKEADQAQALEETKSRFFTNITHELRTPLTLILSPVQRQLQEGAATYSPQLLKGVYHNSKLLLRLINQLLDMSKLEGGNMPVNLSRGNVALFIDGLLDPFRQQAAARNITFLFVPTAPVCVSTNQGAEEHQMQPTYQQLDALPSAPVRVSTNRNTPGPQPVREDTNRDDEEYLFDSDKLEKVLYNLLSNAFKFTPDGGQIQVSVSQPHALPGAAGDKATFQIQVSDSGIGIPPESLPRIFDRFYQVNASTTRKYEGTGIGLSLVKELTELMGGYIKVESTIGKGSVFTLTLPLSVADAVSHYPEASPSSIIESVSTKNGTTQQIVTGDDLPLVLVTEDNEQLRIFIKESLQPHYRVLTAANGEAGLQTVITELPELIISDVMMPVMDGYEFCSKVKENPLTSHIGFVMLTAKTADESRMSGLRLGADHYLGKPFQVEELLLVTGNLLKRQQWLRDFYSKQLQPTEKLPPVAEVEDEFLHSVYTIIENNLDSDLLDVDFLSSKLAVSRRTLNRKLSAVANTSANEIIRTYRLKKAAGLLLKGQNVSEAAYTTGFSTPSWFSQCFKEMYGITPVQYAENGGLSQN